MIEGYRFEACKPEQDSLPMASVYADAFAAPPWNEKYKCGSCGTFYGPELSEQNPCLDINCSGTLGPAYPLDVTGLDILTEITRPGAVANVIRNQQDSVVAFGWGFPYRLDEFLEERYRRVRSREQLGEQLRGVNVPIHFFYVSEVAIKEADRGKGLSNLLVAKLVEAAESRSQIAVMRTNKESPMVAVAQKFGMRQVMGPAVRYNPGLKVILSSAQAVNGIEDPENDARVLFLKNDRRRGFGKVG